MSLFIVGCIIAALAGPVLAPFGGLQLPSATTDRRAIIDRSPARRAGGIVLLLVGVTMAIVGVVSDSGTGECTADGRCSRYHGTPLTQGADFSKSPSWG